MDTPICGFVRCNSFKFGFKFVFMNELLNLIKIRKLYINEINRLN
jgi:hypothetical protein